MTHKLSPFAPVILRLATSLVFLWFGANQLMNPSQWTSFVPSWANFISANLLVSLNGFMEVVLGFTLLLGFQVRSVALILGLHLLVIAGSVGWNAIGVRDFGLSLATLSIVFDGPDMWSIDTKLSKKAPL